MKVFMQFLIAMVGISLFVEGKSQKLCKVNPKWIKPVCGEDNITYQNAKYAKCKGVKIAYQGECKECACNSIFKPVCGVNKKTYDNECQAKCWDVKIAYSGRCKKIVTKAKKTKKTPVKKSKRSPRVVPTIKSLLLPKDKHHRHHCHHCL